MAELYDLEKMRKEIHEDEPPESAHKSKKLSQDEINEVLAQRRKTAVQPAPEKDRQDKAPSA